MSANLLEHVPDDRRALREIARVLKPGRPAAIVVPAGPRTFDYYDRFLGHERRYARGRAGREVPGCGSGATGGSPSRLAAVSAVLAGQAAQPAALRRPARRRARGQGDAGHRQNARLAPGRAHLAAGGSAGRRRCAASVRDPLVRRSLAGVVMRTVSVIIPAYREEANIEAVYERLAHVFEPLAVDWELIFSVDPSPDRTEELILELRGTRSPGEDAPLLASIRAADGDAGRARGGQRRRGRGDRLRPPGSARAHPDDDRALGGGIRRRVRAAPDARRRDAAQADRGVGGLQGDQPDRRGRHPAEHRRLQADEPAGDRQRRRAEGGTRLPARAGRVRRLSPDERPLRPLPARRRREQVQPDDGLAADRAQRRGGLLALSAAADLAPGHRRSRASPSSSRSCTWRSRSPASASRSATRRS